MNFCLIDSIFQQPDILTKSQIYLIIISNIICFIMIFNKYFFGECILEFVDLKNK